MRRLALLFLALALVVGLAACGDDDDSDGGGNGTETTAAPEDGESPGADGSEFEDIASLRDALGEAGIACDLEYEGLADDDREVSQCVIEGEQAVISIWYDPTLRDEVVAGAESLGGAAMAAGANWTVEVATGPVAERVAEALDGAPVVSESTTDQGGATTTTAPA